MLFKNETDKKVFELIAGIYIRSKRLVQQQLKTLNMTFSQFRTMVVLSQKDNITQREFADRLDTDTTTAMVLCDSLEKRGWLMRMPDATDRRVNKIVLTDNGKKVFSQALPLIQKIYKDYALNGISTDKLQLAIPVLEKLFLNINTCLKQKGKQAR
jgi:MarR family transcriptional regulator for hemolysin